MRFPPLLFGAVLLLPAQDSPDVVHARKSYEYAGQGRTSDAEREIRESIRLAPESPLYRSALAGLLQSAGRMEEAKAEIEKAIGFHSPTETLKTQLASRLEEIDLELGAQLAKTGQYNAGLSVAADAARRFPNSPRVLQMRGFFESKRQLNIDAVTSYSRALELDPSSAESSVGLGIAQAAAGMPVEALKTLEAGRERFPRDAMHYQATGVLLLQLADAGVAKAARAGSMFEAALRIDGSLAESHYQLGNLALQNGDLKAAMEHWLAAGRSAPGDSRIHFALARAYRRGGRELEAAREMEIFESAAAAGQRPEQAARVSQPGRTKP